MFSLKFSPLIIGILILIVFSISCRPAPKADSVKVEETKRIWQTIPVYPGMTEVEENTVPVESPLVIIKTYRSNANFADVETFHKQQLTLSRWQLLEEKEIKDRGRILGEQLRGFTKDKYRVLIQFAGVRRAELGWDYAIELSLSDYWKQQVD